jgi:acylglycerol lipase
MSQQSELHERVWPVEGAKAAVVLVHGLGEHIGRYEHVAQALNAAGYAVYATDVRGHGKSVGAPGDMGTDPAAPTNDVIEQCVRVRQEHDKVFLFAHSMGTMISMPAVPKLPDGTIQGLILSGTALEMGPAGGDLVSEGAVPASALSRDEAVQQAYSDDPLVWDKVPPEVLGHAFEIGQRAREAVQVLNVPLLLIHGREDPLTDIKGAEYVYAESIVTDKTIIGYDGLRHEILNEPEKDKVIADVVEWLDKH